MVPPGQAGTIRAALNTAKLRGKVNRSITVRSDDPERPVLLLHLRADVVGSARLLPLEKLTLGNVRKFRRKGYLLVRKEDTEEGELRVGDLRTSVPWLTARATRVDEPRFFREEQVPPGREGDFLLEVELGPDAPLGSGRQEVRFATGLPREPELVVPVSVVVRPIVSFTSPEVVVAPGNTATVQGVLVKGLDPAALVIEARPEGLVLGVESTGPRHFRITLSWDAEQDPPARGEVVFRVGAERTSLPVRFTDAGA